VEFQELVAKAREVRALYSELEREAYGSEWSLGQLAQGFVGDAGDLTKLIMAKEGVRRIDDVDEKLAHELADCLWCVLVLADRLGIDLEAAFLQTMDELKASLGRATRP
jgi:NTP pyrophosphatase (non-canonical NTP hydrolase)